jgi:hypothetical protein
MSNYFDFYITNFNSNLTDGFLLFWQHSVSQIVYGCMRRLSMVKRYLERKGGGLLQDIIPERISRTQKSYKIFNWYEGWDSTLLRLYSYGLCHHHRHRLLQDSILLACSISETVLPLSSRSFNISSSVWLVILNILGRSRKVHVITPLVFVMLDPFLWSIHL